MIYERVQNVACCENEREKATCSRDRAAQNSHCDIAREDTIPYIMTISTNRSIVHMYQRASRI